MALGVAGFCAVVVAAVSLSACAARVRVEEQTRALDYDGKPRRLFIQNTLDDPSADRFAAAVQAGLSRCGVASSVFRPDSMQLDGEARARAAFAGFRPDAILYMRRSGRLVNEYGRVIHTTYLVTLRDVGQRRDVWRARVRLNAATILASDPLSGGDDFATAIVQGLSRDGVFRSCSPPPG